MSVTKNYNQFDFKDIRVKINDNEVALLEEVTYSISQPKTPVYNCGKVVALQTGNETITGSITILQTELYKFKRFFDLDYSKQGKVSEFLNTYFTIIVTYSRNHTSEYEFKTVVDTFENCKLEGFEISNSQGMGGSAVTLPFICCGMKSTYTKGS